MKVKFAFAIGVVMMCLVGMFASAASAQEVTGVLQPNQTVNHTVNLNAQTYNVYLFFDSGDVDWTLYDATSMIAYESGVDNPDIENGVKPPRVGSYRLEVRNLRAQATNYRVQFRTGDSEVVDTEVTVSGNSMQGRFLKSGDEAWSEIRLNAGQYVAYCTFDSGDVDWTLYDGTQIVAQEFGIENPDIEQVKLTRSGTYKLLVRNIGNTATNYKVEFRSGGSVPPADVATGLTFSGTFNKSNMTRSHNIQLNRGVYRVVTNFDRGDVDWTLTRSNQTIALEVGTQNPDIEDNVVVPETGVYRLEVRNLREASSYRIVFSLQGTVPNNVQPTISGMTMRGTLATGGATAEGMIHLPAGPYRVTCTFDSGDVDWVLYNGQVVIANEGGVANPDIEDVNISNTGTYRLVAMNVSNNPNRFTIHFTPGSHNIIPDYTGKGITVTGTLTSSSSRRTHQVNLNAGTYRVTTYFDSGDVDWTLTRNGSTVAYEFGTQNPDIEDNVQIAQSGMYDLEVNNLRNNTNSYRIVFESINDATYPSAGRINISGNVATGYLSGNDNRVQGNIYLNSGTYESVLSFDSGDVDWTLYDGTNVVASESGTTNPDTEVINLAHSRTYRLEVYNLNRNANNFRLEFRRTSSNSSGSNLIRVQGNTIEGVFAVSSIALEQTISLAKGRYEVHCWFDSGDVDWTLRYNNSYVASESGTSNPDIESSVNITQAGTHKIEVRNLHGNTPNKFKIEFRKIS